MRNLMLCLFIALLSFGFVVNEASAQRFGGGRSFGVQRSQSSLFNRSAPQKTSGLGQKTGGSKWGGFIGGALLGGLLASLFMGHGLVTGIFTWIILGVAIFFIVGLFRKNMQPGWQSAQTSAFRQNTDNGFVTASGGPPSDFPSNFDADEFLRASKITFIRMQAAYDQKNMQDLQAFTAPEVFGEIKMQLDERGDAPNKTEVITLNAELLDVSKQSLSLIASVHFTGSIKENNDPIGPLDEIWHFRQFEGNDQWVVGGIQQDVIQPR